MFRDAAASPKADETTLLAATLVAQTALDLLLDPALVADAWREFRGRRGRVTGTRPAGRQPEPAAPATAAAPPPGPTWPSVPTTRETSTSRRETAGTSRTRPIADFDLPTYVGLPTFMRLPGSPTPTRCASARADVAIVGAPFDDAVSHRPGARFGPRAIREAQYTTGSIHSLQLGVEPFEVLDVVDAGDANVVPSWIERAHAFIYRKVHDVASTGAIPIVLGGDHSITWPSATAVAEVRRPGSIGIVHFDAHADTANDDWGVLAGHGTPMRRLIESGAVNGRNFVQVGLRGYWPPVDVFEWMKEHELRWHLMREVEERGAEAVIDDAIAEALDGPDAIYISVDIDVLDPGLAPGHRARPSPAASCRASCCGPSAGSPARSRWRAWTSSRSRRPTTTRR